MKKTYSFFGWERAGSVTAQNPVCPGIITPLDLYDRLESIWCADTCAPRLRAAWTQENKTLGQCSITAFLAQDLFGGEVYAMSTDNGGLHCYNCVNGVVFDLTSEQFEHRAGELTYDCAELQNREMLHHFGKTEKRMRYFYLKDRLFK